MATVNKVTMTRDNIGGMLFSNIGGVGLANGDQSNAFTPGAVQPTKMMQITGTFGAGGSIQLEESNDGSNWFINGTAKAAAGVFEISTAAKFYRWNVTAGDGTTSLFASLFCVAQRGS